MDQSGFVKDDNSTTIQILPSPKKKPWISYIAAGCTIGTTNLKRTFTTAWLVHAVSTTSLKCSAMICSETRSVANLKKHFESIFPYWNDGQMEFKDLEITALSRDYTYSTMIQHTWGTAGGTPFDTAFRRTGIAHRSPEDGKWRWIHEHLSFPVDMKTQKGDFTASLDPGEGFKLQ
ncbi:hypothetical protein N7481_005042 [Penicillium waksmanii]|uniref:uncharacterized protein n=1 Tax=Penicillium waksmanii TaxID=69791 RepID=UPI0025473DBC|nr:uncharacterized protein N7481_005042 [Penicillium waksmanii]KAJ5982943.1 hypothetical protein N7481_005042 [Penicillium waksmanii]